MTESKRSAAGASKQPFERSVFPVVDAKFSTLLRDATASNHGFGGSMLRVESLSGGKVLWEGAAGTRKHDSDTALELQDRFEIASVAKMFTAAAVLMLVEEGSVKLNEPVRRALSAQVMQGLLIRDGHDYGDEITVRQLLNHTSGLADYWSDGPLGTDGNNAFMRAFMSNPDRIWLPSELLEYARGLDSVAKPGARYHYSDTGYVVLGLLLEKLMGMPLQQIFHERLFIPLQMADTFTIYRESPKTIRALAHRYEGELDLYEQARQSAEWAGGGIVSTAQDLGRFMRALMRDALFKDRKTRDLMMQWIPTGAAGIEYGAGLFRVALDGNLGHAVGHDGHGNSFAFVVPEQDIVCVGTMNQLHNDWWPLFTAIMQAIGSVSSAK